MTSAGEINNARLMRFSLFLFLSLPASPFSCMLTRGHSKSGHVPRAVKSSNFWHRNLGRNYFINV